MLMCVLLVNFAMSSLALQAQKQTNVMEKLQNRRALSQATETLWTWGQSCNDACTALSPSATCDPDAAAEIIAAASWKALASKGLNLSACKQFPYSTSGWGPILMGPGLCFGGGGVNRPCALSVANTSTTSGEFLCACSCAVGECSISEDPHINNFDDAQVSLLATTSTMPQGVGDKWLVSSSRVKIQARFMEKNAGPSSDGKMFTRAIALGGDILNGNVMVIGSLEDNITWNGSPVLQTQGSSFSMREDSFSIDASRGFSSLVQNLSQANQGVNIRLQSSVSLIVNRLHRYINVAIKMPQQAGGQEGFCGNFNGFGADDGIDLMKKRFVLNVAPDESLFADLEFE